MSNNSGTRRRRRAAWVLWTAAVVNAACQTRLAGPGAPPETRATDVAETRNGTRVADPYRWLEGHAPDAIAPTPLSAEVATWADRQNAYARATLAELPGRPRIEQQLGSLVHSGVVGVPEVRGNRYFFLRSTALDSRRVLLWRHGYLGPEKPLIDPSLLDRTGRMELVWFSPSPGGHYVAFGEATPGAQPRLRVVNVDSGRIGPLVIPHVTEAVQWLPDDSAFYYQIDEQTGRSGYVHWLDARRADAVLFTGGSAAAGSFVSVSADGHWLVIGVPRGSDANDVWLADFDAFLRSGRIAPQPLVSAPRAQSRGTVVGNAVFLQSTMGAPHGRILAADVRSSQRGAWRVVVPERADAEIVSAHFGAYWLEVTYRKNACDAVEIFDLAGQLKEVVTLPGIGVVPSLASSSDPSEAFFTYTSFNCPPTVFRIDLDRPTEPAVPWMVPEVPVDPASVAVEQVWYPARDGTPVSMFLVHPVGSHPAGHAPTLLLGYGAFGVQVTPTFSASFFQWFDSGGWLAIPNVRGGGEFGQAWHAAGSRGRKVTAVQDFIDAADWLVAQGYTRSDRLALYGGDHGSLLPLVAITERPGIARAVVARNPLADMVRSELFAPGQAWVSEYGSAADPTQLPWLLSDSPYHRTRPGSPYPAVLLLSQANRGPVDPMHARKLTAALQAATASNPTDRPILLKIAGSEADAFQDLVDERAFVMWQLRVK
jgi:prolyl oligopeptidase